MSTQEATAKVLRVREHRGSEDQESTWRVTFKFLNESTGEKQQGFSVVNKQQAGSYSANQSVPIEYYDETLIGSRLAGETNKKWVVIFLGTMVLCVFSVVGLSLHSVYEERRLRQRKWWIR